MKKRYFAVATLALGAMTTAAFSQADRLAIQSQPAHDGTPAWHLGPSFRIRPALPWWTLTALSM